MLCAGVPAVCWGACIEIQAQETLSAHPGAYHISTSQHGEQGAGPAAEAGCH